MITPATVTFDCGQGITARITPYPEPFQHLFILDFYNIEGKRVIGDQHFVVWDVGGNHMLEPFGAPLSNSQYYLIAAEGSQKFEVRHKTTGDVIKGITFPRVATLH